MRQKYPMQELELKVQGGLCARGGVIVGFYGNIYVYILYAGNNMLVL